MTDFIRNILVNATVNAANAAAAATAAASSEAAVKAEMAKPVNQIQIPAAVASLATADCALPVEKQRLIKVEILQETATTTGPMAAATDAGKAQRAARRDVVNARRDKRKAMAQSASSVPSSPMEMTSCGGSSSDSEDELEDKCKKMKTGMTSSLAVVGGLAVSENSKKPSLSSTMPPTPGLLFTPEIDAAGEERLRAMEAQLETLDPDSKEAKKKRRLIRNRMSAQLHRERKKAYVGQLEDQLMEKDRELKLLQEKMAKMMEDTEKLKSEVEKTKTMAPTPAPAVTAKPAQPTPVAKAPLAKIMKKTDDEVVIKEEPTNWDSPWPLDAAETWDLHGLEDSEMADLETADLLRDFDDPFAGLGGAEYADLCKPHHEIHAAKKNLAMMAAVMFSVSFFGNSPSFYNVTPGSSFSSTFGAQPPKEFSQMSIASRIVACLEKTSWKEFRDVSSWISARTADAAQEKEDAEKADETDDEDAVSVQPVSSPSAASDITDTTGSTCGSPSSMIDDCLDDAAMTETDLIDEFEYPVEDPFGAGAGADWLVDEHDLNKDTHKKEDFFLSDFVMAEEPQKTQPAAPAKSSSISSRLYESLTALWREKNQVLLTVRNDKQQVLQRSIADMSTIREGLQSGNFFTKVFGDNANQETAQEDQSVSFLYPMSAFSSEAKPLISESSRASDAAAVDPVFLEVSCQMNGAVAASQM